MLGKSVAVKDTATTTVKPPRFVKARDIAEIYGVTVPCVFKWARDGKIPSVSFETTRRFDLEAVRAVIEGKVAK